MTRTLAKLVLAMLAAVVALLLVEGVLSLGFKKSLRPKTALDPSRLFAPGATNAAPINGIFASNIDPAVAHTLRLNADLVDRTAKFHTGALGIRERQGPAPAANALRVVVLGDSVAFGASLTDEETIASRLEAALAESRGPSARPAACFTVAVPGWNHRNAVQFLADHFEEFAPDVVVYLPVSNDLYDSLSIGEGGLTLIAPDPMSEQPLLTVNHESLFAYQFFLAARVERGEVKNAVTSLDDIGPPGVLSDLGAESRRRYDDNADSILRLEHDLAARGKKLAVFFYAEDPGSSTYTWILRERLLDRGLVAPEIPGLARMSTELGLPGDPHPNAECARGLARMIAEGLLENGLVDKGEGRPLPEMPALVGTNRATRPDAATIRARAAAARAEGARILQSEIDLTTGRGFQQVLGGMNPDGSARCRFLCLLRAAGPTLRLRLGAIAGKTVIYPLAVEVLADGASIGTVTVPAGDEITEAVLPLPASIAEDAAFEVALVPARWTTTTFEKRPIVASFRVLDVRSER